MTGSTGFVGRWLSDELRTAGHQVIPTPASRELPIVDFEQVRQFVLQASPEAIVHLASVSFGPDAESNAAMAVRTNVGGTLGLVDAMRSLEPPPLLVAVSSSDVYGAPRAADLPLTEQAAVKPRNIYGITKAAQEAVALSAATLSSLPVVVVRPFNHTGPGQRRVFAVPAFIERAMEVAAGRAASIRVGNIDVRRDIGDVRDVVRAYRLIVEAYADGSLGQLPRVFNIATGVAIPMSGVIGEICRLLSIDNRTEADPRFVRENDPPEIAGDATVLTKATGWLPRIPIRQTLADMIAAARG